MKRILLLLIFFVVNINSQYAQEAIKRNMIYKTSIRLISDPSYRCYGALYTVNDSSISISNHRVKELQEGNYDISEFYVSDLEHIRIRRPGNILRGTLIGAGSGLIIGSIAGYASGDDTSGWFAFTAEEKAIAGGLGLSFFGAIIGFFIDACIDITIPIYGNRVTYDQNRQRLEGYSLRNNY